MTSTWELEMNDILILGASVLGVELVHQLQRRRRLGGLRVTVVDRFAEHDYIPLLHERLSGRLRAAEGRLPTAGYVRSFKGHDFVQGEVTHFDPTTRTAQLADGRRLSGRVVVIALGSEVGPPAGLHGREHVRALKFGPSVQDELRALATREPLRMVVVGGGISGVELAGELAHMGAHPQAGGLAPHVCLVHSSLELLPGFHPRVRKRAETWLARQGVELRLSQRLQRVDGTDVTLVDDHQHSAQMHADRVYWAGGIHVAPLLKQLPLDHTDDGYLSVDAHLRPRLDGVPVPGLFAGGDAVRVVESGTQWPTMQRAIEALWQAKTLAINIDRTLTPENRTALRTHPLRRNFAHGISLGQGSLVVWGRLLLDYPRLNTWFRRFLMRRYMARYLPRPQ